MRIAGLCAAIGVDATAMANRSYLTATNADKIYPSFLETDYDPDDQVLAGATCRVPLLWCSIFRSQDIRREQLEIDDKRLTASAPIAERAEILGRLDHTTRTLDKMFPNAALGEYVELLGELLQSTSRRFVTIEYNEVAMLNDPPTAYERMGACLLAFSGQIEPRQCLQDLVDLSGIDPRAIIPSARRLVDGGSVSEEAALTHQSLIGYGWVRTVPWASA